MATTEITPKDKNCILIWQDVPEGVGEPAILITPYSDCIILQQEGRYININYETVKELCKHLKNMTP